MKVKDFMRKHVVYVHEDDEIKRAVRYIFNLGLSGVPVVKKRKIVGLVTETDILHKLFPSVAEFMEDSVHGRNFEDMEHNLHGLLAKPVKTIMSEKPRCATADTPLMKAQSLMLINKFSRLPIVDRDENLIGIISQGDIFRALAGQEIPYDDREEYDAWLSYHYDLVVPWGERLGSEIPSLAKLFEKYDVKTVIDIFCGTGEHDIALAKRGFNMTGVNKYDTMHKNASKKFHGQADMVKNLLEFELGDYVKTLKQSKEQYDGAIIMGNALAHSPHDWKEIVAGLGVALAKKNAVAVIQVANFEKILKKNKRLQDFNVATSRLSGDSEYGFLEFFDPARGDRDDNLTLTMAILVNRGTRWMHAGINSTIIANVSAKNIEPLLKKAGFKKVELFGSRFLEPLFKEKFDIDTHDWLNVVASR